MDIKFFFGAIMASLCLLNSFFCDATSVNPDKELIFDSDSKIFDKITETSHQYYIACSAASDDEVKFNETKSISKNSLFLRDMLVPAERDTPLVECEHPYKPSILFHESPMRFENGFEVYYDKIQLQGKGLIYVSKSRFLTTAQLKANNKLINKLRGILPISLRRSKSQNDKRNANDSGSQKKNQTDSVKKSNSNSDAENETQNEKKVSDDIEKESEDSTKKDLEKTLVLLWIQVFYFDFDVEQCSPTKIVYSADVGELNTAYLCTKFGTDETLYENIDFQSIYQHDNQRKLFEKLPEFPTLPKEQCGHKYGCLKPHQVIPHYYYHSEALKMTTCSAVNTLPVWDTISDGMLEKIDRYLFAISQIWGPNITITTGVTGILSYRASRFSLLSKKLFMDMENKKVPVPLIIYKILKFTKGKDDFHVIFVTHNDPVTKELNHICPLNPGDWLYEKFLESWKFVENQVTESGRSYPCPMRPEVLDSLNVHRHRSDDMYYRTLLLDDFPPIGLTKEQTIEVIPQTSDEKPQPIEEKTLTSEEKTQTVEEGKNPAVQKKQTIEEIRQLIEQKVVELFGEAW